MIYYLEDNDIFFNSCVLGVIDQYLKINKNLQIKTLSKYAVILELLFDNIECIINNVITNNDISFYKFFNIKSIDKYNLNKLIIYQDELLVKKYNYENIICVKIINKNIVSLIANLIKDTFLFINHHIIVITDNLDVKELIYLLNNNLLLLTDDINLIYLSFNCPIKNVGFIINNNSNNINKNIDNINSYYKNNLNKFNFYMINTNNIISYPKFRINFLYDNKFININKNNKSKPFVSCICPTYNRINFIPNLIKIFQSQDYPSNFRELIILDDSINDATDLIKKLDIENNIKYYHINNNYKNKPLSIGKKRNLLHQLISGEYILCFDDDDYYPPNKISKSINKLLSSNIKFGGSSKLYIYYTDIKKVYEFGPYSKYHATNGTFVYHYSYIFTNFYNDNSKFAEEKTFLNNFTEKLIQLEPLDTILCIAHDKNTYDKKNIIHNGKLTNYKLNNLILNKKIFNFFNSL